MISLFPIPKRFARWWMMCLALAFCVAATAQNKIEYFWNTDPGEGKGTKVGFSGETVNFELSTEALPVGIHQLGIRAIEGNNYSSTLLCTVIKPAVFASDAKIEYFWDADPGVGKAVAYDVALDGDDVVVDMSLLTESLATGTHLLGLRVYNGCWSNTSYYIVVVADGSAHVSRMEYFWDTDPGVGKAESVPINGETSVISLPADNLSQGIHLLGIRAFGASWSNTMLRYVTVSSGDDKVHTVEYFWDMDPGIGMATALPVDDQSSVALSLDTESLAEGMHLLGIRAFGSSWSSTILRFVAISSNGGKVQQVEYFWDTDPGYGNGTPLPFTGDNMSVVNAEIVAPLDFNPHVLYIRAMSNGRWSAPYAYKISAAEQHKYQLAVSKLGYATLYLDFAVKIPEEVSAYVCAQVDGDQLMMQRVDGEVLPAYTGVIVKAEAGNYSMDETLEQSVAIGDNLFKGTVVDCMVTAEKNTAYYVLSCVNDEVAMYRAAINDDGKFKNNAFRAYLPLNLFDIFNEEVDSENVQLSRKLIFNFGNETSVEELDAVSRESDSYVYDLSGRRIRQATRGLYIKNGKKVFISR